jgi:murein DD-endopeptidase MepM/ murein hydrolase activator NlpD
MKAVGVVMGAVGVLLLIAIAAARGYRILTRQVVRMDAAGSGHYGSSRGSRTHKGIDLLATPGEPVYSPGDGVVDRVTRPYLGDTRYYGVVLDIGPYTWEIHYVEPAPGIFAGARVKRGQVIGTAQDISAKYGGPMRPHIHVEVLAAGSHIDPADILVLDKSQA